MTNEEDSKNAVTAYDAAMNTLTREQWHKSMGTALKSLSTMAGELQSSGFDVCLALDGAPTSLHITMCKDIAAEGTPVIGGRLKTGKTERLVSLNACFGRVIAYLSAPLPEDAAGIRTWSGFSRYDIVDESRPATQAQGMQKLNALILRDALLQEFIRSCDTAASFDNRSEKISKPRLPRLLQKKPPQP